MTSTSRSLLCDTLDQSLIQMKAPYDSARSMGADTWLWFDSYIECLIKVAQERKGVSPHLACAPKPDALTDRVLILYGKAG